LKWGNIHQEQYYHLVGGLEHLDYLSILIGNFIIPTGLSYVSRWLKPSSSHGTPGGIPWYTTRSLQDVALVGDDAKIFAKVLAILAGSSALGGGGQGIAMCK